MVSGMAMSLSSVSVVVSSLLLERYQAPVITHEHTLDERISHEYQRL